MILERNEAEDKIRTLREEVLKKERRLHEDIKIRSDDIDRQSYNQRDRLKTLSENPRDHKFRENSSKPPNVLRALLLRVKTQMFNRSKTALINRIKTSPRKRR